MERTLLQFFNQLPYEDENETIQNLKIFKTFVIKLNFIQNIIFNGTYLLN